MLVRKIQETVRQALSRQASVALIGPRQVGKTTLALHIGEEWNALYLDLEDVQERDKLSTAAVFWRRMKSGLSFWMNFIACLTCF